MTRQERAAIAEKEEEVTAQLPPGPEADAMKERFGAMKADLEARNAALEAQAKDLAMELESKPAWVRVPKFLEEDDTTAALLAVKPS